MGTIKPRIKGWNQGASYYLVLSRRPGAENTVPDTPPGTSTVDDDVTSNYCTLSK
jgi:hypothetical protein